MDYGHTSMGQPSRTLHQLCANTGCSMEDLLGGIDGERARERERVREIRAVSLT